jgi:DNA-binding response OmpR family regulator
MLIAGVKGHEVCTQLKKDAATAHYPIMMMTALPDAEKLCREHEADDFIAMPFEMMQMISKINMLTQFQNNPK